MTLKKLRELTKNMPDDTMILARDRDYIHLDMVNIVGTEGINEKRQGREPSIYFNNTIEEVYGGDSFDLKHKQAIVFCACD